MRLTFLLVFLSACFNPDPTRITYKCDAENACPDGMICQNSLCVASAPLDQGSPPDALSSGCADGGGSPVGAMAYACPGAFSSGQAAGRCAAGWHLCPDASAINLTECQALSGFFVTDVPAKFYATPPINVTCERTSVGMGNWGFFGCGGSRPYAYAVTPSCSGFDHVVDCITSQNMDKWDCSGGAYLNTIINKIPGDGVLCCR